MSPASSSSRWCPTPEQLMILEELYRSGIRTPNASQIQRITAHLSLYGKIEGKNVFYWFQNHKARDRQKLRRKLIKQLQHDQFYHPHHHDHAELHHNLSNNYHLLDCSFDLPLPPTPATSSSAFHPLPYHHNSFGFLPQGGLKVLNHPWEMEIPQSLFQMENSMTRMYSHDWVMMVEVGSASSPSSTRPLETLDLFPIKATNLKEECNVNKTLTSSSSSSTYSSSDHQFVSLGFC